MGVGSHGAQPSRPQPQFAAAAEIWRRALAQLRNTLPRNTYETWFASARAVELRAGVLILSVDNIYKRETLVTNYYSTISVAVAEVLGHRIEIEVEVNTDPPADQTPDTTLAGAAAPAPSVVPTRPVLKSSYTLSSFVVGPSNQIAHAAASAVAENPGRSHNPALHLWRLGPGQDAPAAGDRARDDAGLPHPLHPDGVLHPRVRRGRPHRRPQRLPGQVRAG